MSEDQDKRTGAVPNGTIDPKNRPVVQVRDVMYKLFLTVTPDTPVRKVFRMFIKYRLMAIPVVDEEDHLIGLITSADLMYKQTKPHVPRSLPIIGSKIFTNRMNGYAKDFKKLMDEPCEKIMTKDVIIATPEADTEQIAGVMACRRKPPGCRYHYAYQYPSGFIQGILHDESRTTAVTAKRYTKKAPIRTLFLFVHPYCPSHSIGLVL